MPAELSAEARESTGKEKMKKLRARGVVPAVVYGYGKPAVMIQLERRAFDKFYAKRERIVTIRMPDGQRQALVKEVQIEPLSQTVLHVDFQEVRADQEVTVTVTVKLKGTAVGVKDGGVVTQELHVIQVSCIPAKIPHEVTVDVSNMALGDAIRAKEVPLPEGVALSTEPEQVVVNCRLPLVVEEPEAADAAAAAPAAPEVLTERKKDEEAPEGGAPGA
jgi:large subunit ribosomal protein L25